MPLPNPLRRLARRPIPDPRPLLPRAGHPLAEAQTTAPTARLLAVLDVAR